MVKNNSTWPTDPSVCWVHL